MTRREQIASMTVEQLLELQANYMEAALEVRLYEVKSMIRGVVREIEVEIESRKHCHGL